MFIFMCCKKLLAGFLFFLTLSEKGHLETPTLVYEKNARMGKPLLYDDAAMQEVVPL